MVHVEIRGQVHGVSATDAFALLRDFGAYSGYTDAVRSIVVSQEDGKDVSKWEVNFRDGILRWKEEDTYLPEEHAIVFRQLEGDIDSFAGRWSAADAGDGCEVAFVADFDLGLAGLGALLEPIADKTLRETVRSILTGLLGEVEFAT